MQEAHFSRELTRFALGIAIAVSANAIMAPAAHAQAGAAGLAFLKLGTSANGVAMGDAMSAAVRGAASTFYNPAGLGAGSSPDMRTEFLLMHKEWIQDTRTEFLGSRFSIGDHHAFGVSVLTTTVDNIEIRTKPGEAQGTFSSRDLGLGVSYCYALSEGVRAGVTARFLYEQILVDDAQGMGIDAGVQYEGVLDGLTLGATVANLGKMSDFRNEALKLPALIRAGAAYRMELTDLHANALMAADVEDVFAESQLRPRLGAECGFRNVFFVRAGYQFGSEGRGLSVGGGVQYGMFGVDYGFSRLSSDLGNGHTLSLRAEF
jgi:hypothetical protein